MESETFKFKNFELTLESGGGDCHLEIDNNSQKVFFSFRFSKEDIQDILNELKIRYVDSEKIYEAKSLIYTAQYVINRHIKDTDYKVINARSPEYRHMMA